MEHYHSGASPAGPPLALDFEVLAVDIDARHYAICVLALLNRAGGDIGVVHRRSRSFRLGKKDARRIGFPAGDIWLSVVR